VNAGLYKPQQLLFQHHLVLTALVGKPVSLTYQLHGRRQRKTAALICTLFNQEIWPFIDKFIHEFLILMPDFTTPKLKRKKLKENYSLRIRQKLFDFGDFGDLLEQVMYDTHRGVFLPLQIHFLLQRTKSYMLNESYLRMARIPFHFYKRRCRPAFDDPTSFIVGE
jgi:hypothetical protein